MKRTVLFLSVYFLALLASSGYVLLGIEPVKPVPKGLRFPVLPEAPNPPSPKMEPARLSGEQLYVVESDTPHLLFASPLGLVGVVEESGPLRIRGRFVDGNGKVETR